MALGGAGDRRPARAGSGRELDGAADAVTAFWGDDWPRDIVIVLTGTDEEFRALAGGGPDIAAATTAQRIVFAPGRGAMSDASLRIVLRHELFHYAARSRDRRRRAALAHRGRRRLRRSAADAACRAGSGPRDLAQLPTDADLDTVGRGAVAGLRPGVVVQPIRRRPLRCRRRCASCTSRRAARATPTRRPPSARPSAPTRPRCSPRGAPGSADSLPRWPGSCW